MPSPAPARPQLTGLDLLAGGAVLLVGLVSWVSLALAHLGEHSLPAVVALTLAALVTLGLVLRRWRPAVRRDLAGVAVGLGCAAVMVVMSGPGFSYGVADKDPGGYVAHAHAIARVGDHSFVDEALSARLPDGSPLPVQLTSPGARFGGVWIRGAQEDGWIVPQFYHLWPALLATSLDVAGEDGLRATVPLMGVLSVLCLVALTRRVAAQLLGGPVGARAGPDGPRAGPDRTDDPGALAGLVAAGAAGLLLATNMLQVWQNRFPSTEVFAQALYLGALLGLVVAIQTGWRPAAGVAGLLVGIGWLNRADGVLVVLMAAGLAALVLAARRVDGRAWWFLGGLGVVAPHAAWQAYDRAAYYSQANGVPSARLLTAALVTAVVLGAAAGRVAPLSRLLTRAVTTRRTQVVLGLGVCAVCAGLLALGFLRPRLFGADFFNYNGRIIPSYDEQILRRLSWFLTLPGFALMGAGVAVATLRRWTAATWAVLLPTLFVLVVYGATAKNSTRMLWWTRRYVPTVLPGFLLLVALALAFAFVWRFRGRAPLRLPAVLALGGLLAAFGAQSWPLRSHDEWKGSAQVARQIADLSPGTTGVYLWEGQPCCNKPTSLFAVPVWLTEGELSIRLPDDPANRQRVIDLYKAHFAGRPLYVVADGTDLPRGVDPAAVTPLTNITASLPMWEESDTERPDEPREVAVAIAVWQVTGT